MQLNCVALHKLHCIWLIGRPWLMHVSVEPAMRHAALG